MTPAAQLESFLARYDAPIVAQARAARKKLRALLPDAQELIYDNYNALVILFAAGERTADRVVSIALYPRWVTLFFWNGPTLKDPKKLLQGTGSTVRSFRLNAPTDLDNTDLIALIRQAAAKVHFTRHALIIKSVVKKQRTRRPK